MVRQILANFDKEGIILYQAFKPSTAEEAVRLGTFGTGFSLERMTWIKPSFGWMLYRSGYPTKQGQECILNIKLTHEGFQTILAQAIPSSFDRKLFQDLPKADLVSKPRSHKTKNNFLQYHKKKSMTFLPRSKKHCTSLYNTLL